MLSLDQNVVSVHCNKNQSIASLQHILDLVLNNTLRMICHKIQSTNQPTSTSGKNPSVEQKKKSQKKQKLKPN